MTRAIAIVDVALGRTALAEAHHLADVTAERFFLAELHRLNAAVCLAENASAHQEAEHLAKLTGDGALVEFPSTVETCRSRRSACPR